MMRATLAALLVAALGQPMLAQAPAAPGPVLTLDEAITLARRNNPLHQQTLTARQRAGAQLRNAYGALTPTLSAGFSSSYREGRPQIINGVPFGNSRDVISSGAGFSLNGDWSGSSILAPKQQRANLDAAEADITSSEVNLRNNITAQYLTALQAQARAVLQDTLVASAQQQLELARAREAVGAASSLDVRRAEVQLGQQQVTRIRERNSAEIEKLRLFQQMGVAQPPGVRLTSQFPVDAPTVQLPVLLDQARSGNPAIVALRARQRSADVSVSRAKTAYIPSLSLSTGISGFTQQNQDIDGVIADEAASTAQQQAACFTQDSIRTGAGMPSINARCQTIVFTQAEANAIRTFNEQWPFDMTRNPISLSVQFSLPIWDGYSRERQVQEATAQRRDAEFNVKQQDLRLTADVTAAHMILTAAYEAVRIQEQNSLTARDALTLAQERFRVGASSFIDVQTARADYERAETDRINAIYEFHKAFAALEAAVGRPLR